MSGLEQVAWPLGPQFPLCDAVLMVQHLRGPQKMQEADRPQPEQTAGGPLCNYPLAPPASLLVSRHQARPASGSVLGPLRPRVPSPSCT